MIWIDYIKKYTLTLLTLIILSLVAIVAWQLYDRIYAPLFIRPVTATTPEATQYYVPAGAITQALEQLQNKQTLSVDVTVIETPLTPPPSSTSHDDTQLLTEGITIDATAP